MGLRDWLPGTTETALETAQRLRAEALEDPAAVDTERLMELYLEAGDPDVCRAAAKGIGAIADHQPEALADVASKLITGSAIVDGVGAKQRGELAAAVEKLARVDPSAVRTHADMVLRSLEAELDADEQPGTDVRLYEDKTAAMARTAGLVSLHRAEPILEKLTRHHNHEVSDAAREALANL